MHKVLTFLKGQSLNYENFASVPAKLVPLKSVNVTAGPVCIVSLEQQDHTQQAFSVNYWSVAEHTPRNLVIPTEWWLYWCDVNQNLATRLICLLHLFQNYFQNVQQCPKAVICKHTFVGKNGTLWPVHCLQHSTKICLEDSDCFFLGKA